MIIVLRMIRIPLLANRSKYLALLDNITICDRVVGSFGVILPISEFVE
jgi:hypothetical protein